MLLLEAETLLLELYGWKRLGASIREVIKSVEVLEMDNMMSDLFDHEIEAYESENV